MEYIEISVKTTTFGSDLVADIFQELTGEGVSIYDKNDLNVPTWDYIEDGLRESYDKEVIVNGYAKKENSEKVLSELAKRFKDLKNLSFDVGSLDISIKITESDTWRDVWKKYFKPIKIKDIVICPMWIDYQAEKTEKIVKIDPGFAFGTGEHETTAMIISFMQDVDIKNKNVIDVGCGSGILGLCAKKLDAKKVVMIDIDEQAYEASEENVQLNGYEKSIEIQCSELSQQKECYDVILANLTADILKIISQDICNHTKDESIILISGILISKCEETIKLFTSLGFNLLQKTEQGEWSALKMQKAVKRE
ncbi:MAG: 50S ribosomal protein L11 methyltransferase [Clostridia bacterium]